MPAQRQEVDITTLFDEDLDPNARIGIFEGKAEQLREGVGALATDEVVESANERYALQFVFNSHGNAIHAAQSVEAGGDAFISFVENAGDTEIVDSGLFGFTVENAFDMRFNGMEPRKLGIAPPPSGQDFGYWRDRGLLARGSIVAPVDIKHYSKALLDALIGRDYDQRFLSSSIPEHEIAQKPLEQLVEEQAQRGQLVMHSNAVRELTSTKQVLGTLKQLDEVEEGQGSLGDKSDKARALAQRARVDDDRLPVNVLYGTAHYRMPNIYGDHGIETSSVFPGEHVGTDDEPFVGSVLDQFFSAHATGGLSEDEVQLFASQLVLEGMLWAPIDNTGEYGLIPSTHDVSRAVWPSVMEAAKKEDSIDRLAEIHAEFCRNPLSVVPLLEEVGLEFIKID